MQIDKKSFLDGLGGPEAAARMDHESRADALESHMMSELNAAIAAKKPGEGAPAAKQYPTAAEVEAQIETKPYRAGVGFMMVSRSGQLVKKLPPMPEKPKLADFFRLRFADTAHHCLQSANLAMKNGMSEEVILACLLHDVVQEIMRTDHGWWGAQLYEPYVSEKTAFAIRYHQALRFYEDKENGYEYPVLYNRMFGSDYKPEPYIEAAYQMVRKHKWYIYPRQVTVNDLYAFDPHVKPQLEQFTDIIGRHFRQPEEGLGHDNSPVAHMWRSIARPDAPL